MDCQGKCVVVGYGHMGRKIAEVLSQLGFASILVDPVLNVNNKTGNVYSNIDDLLLINDQYIKAWFICTPTATHLDVLNKIISKFPDSRVMIEKPACKREQISKLLQVSHNLRLENIWINNHYADCINLELAKSFLNKNHFVPKKIVIDFCKNRSNDVSQGRYIDQDFMLWGYEGFHMLYIATQLISTTDADEFINMQGEFNYFQGNYSQISWVVEYGKLASGLKTLLRTSTDGSTFFQGFRKGVLKANQRSRQVNILLENSTNLRLIFSESREVQFEPSQEYCFSWQSADNGRKYELWQEDNPLKKHLKRFLEDTNISAKSTLSQGLKLTERLSHMTERAYSGKRFNKSTL
ncbi:MAG: Gfo/Idh/MocA family oxidoreductase [Microcoleus sp. PH2017_10_PVI_O_A]|uniref:Gfo/Idh/MocA family oxidoreductase n=1 Tax=unclassified Microcoleus TaxID=2642155 RepID=UPI001DAE55EF|nr:MULTISPECIES: Gfo/Idh/MocA family oxidoreductase [unclassified Microcoleus]MCC3407953.1 Gfo/Idh/MocA family oxidoreductase [Microcoleus sp. PH2017_10_PVI_O_A]MCC3462124.1 Gfo/Idh/MocA family oxidoreductase [Microcoleus sp. PH2017_11_PCY_U_A]MCC3480557.1 Gfo/Idh/MocA family oxidoreductase [Microcoleus sp. PH2017_12_PCY_D_A]MCC3529961.1 Gfo/Idh/MocA family oxidoreductase [Microcoleus sp. PH2017_21_RUC_O_A]MCC3542255.1 Gfo/Idh/MocA family oxidoreductase [Microcoleus sp. PH2017_22_RUC_O_B]